MQKNEVFKVFGETAEKAAKQVCGRGECFCAYECGHSNKAGNGKSCVPTVGEDTVCPIAKYNVTPDTRTFEERLATHEQDVDMNGLFALCACCEHSDGAEKVRDCYVLNRTTECYMNHCLDCPVNMTRECMEEGCAEAAMS